MKTYFTYDIIEITQLSEAIIWYMLVRIDKVSLCRTKLLLKRRWITHFNTPHLNKTLLNLEKMETLFYIEKFYIVWILKDDIMEDVKYKYIVRTYHIFCLVVAITLTSWCIYEYSMDRDVTEIRLRKFHETKEDVHPSITICSLNPFWEEKYRTRERGMKR